MISQDRNGQSLYSKKAGRLNDRLLNNLPNSSKPLTLLAQKGWLRSGVPENLGGTGGRLLDAIEAIAAVSAQSLTSGLIFWSQRASIEFLVASNNSWLQKQVLPKLLRAEWSGSADFLNAMKHQVRTEQHCVGTWLDAETVTLNGFLPWVPNLNHREFVVSVVAQTRTGESLVAAVPAVIQGLKRGKDQQWPGLQTSWTSTLQLHQVKLPRNWIINDDAYTFLLAIRPTLLLLQSGLGLGIARRSLEEVHRSLRGISSTISDRLQATQKTLSHLETTLHYLSDLSTFDATSTRQLIELRIALTRLAMESVWLELDAKGGAISLKFSSMARRLQEVTVLPVLTPSVVQLEIELSRYTPKEG
jgi:alkylation response protein AidB-like acyl-CoA dehydrogenase